MKINKHTPLLAILFASGTLHAQTIVPAPGVIVQGDSLVEGDSTIEGDANVQGATLLNGTLTVQPDVLVIPGAPVVTPGPGDSTNLGGVVAGTGGDVIITQTLIDTTNNSQVVTGGGGATIQTNGDTQLSAPTSTTSTVNYGRAVTFEVAQAGNSNPVGLPIAGTHNYYLTNAAGDVVVAGPFPSEVALDAYIATLTPATMLSLDPTLGTQETSAGAGGNLTVEGNADVDGTLSVGAVADVEAALGGLQTEIDAEEVTRANADTALKLKSMQRK
jgi:hypothetical protein